jgi:hypothetical protein
VERISASVLVETLGETACGFIRCGNVSGTFREGNAPTGEIPGALSARNKAGAVPEGANRQEGSQTLKAERSGAWKPREEWTSGSSCAEGSKSPREEPACCGTLARIRWAKLYRETNSRRGSGGSV